MTDSLSRRAALQRAAYVTAGATVGSHLLTTPVHAAGPQDDALRKARERAQQRKDHFSTGIQSQNGWEMEKVADDRCNIYTRAVSGTVVAVQVRLGDVEAVLAHVIRRFHYEVDALLEKDVVGWRNPRNVNHLLPESNQASGTAVQIRPDWYPVGTRGGFFPQQLVVIRDILAECEGVIRWGGDDAKVDESLFYIDVKPGDKRLPALVGKIRTWKDAPGQGAGLPTRSFLPERRKAANDLANRQRRS